MSRKNQQPDVSRRKFLAGVAVAGAATTVAKPNGARGCGRLDRRQAAAVRVDAHRAADRHRDRKPARAHHPDRGPAGVRLHGRRHQGAEHRILLLQPGVELPCAARVDDQLQQQQEAGVHHRHPRRSVGGDVPRLLQGHRQAADGAVPRHRRPATCLHGGLQRVGRPRAGHPGRRQRSRRLQASAGRADRAFGAGHQRAGARLHQVGRHTRVAAAFRAVVRARLQVRDDAALRAGDDRARCRHPAGSPQGEGREGALYAEIHRGGAAPCRPRGLA